MRRLTLSLGILAALAFVSQAAASQVISTSTVTGLTLQLNDKGEALLTYTSAGKRVHVLAWGAINAAATTHLIDAGWLESVPLAPAPQSKEEVEPA